MCTVSSLGDAFNRRWPQVQPYVQPYVPPATNSYVWPSVSREDFDALKRDVEELKELLKAAKRIDEFVGDTDCENDAKLAVLRKVADLVGVDLSGVLD